MFIRQVMAKQEMPIILEYTWYYYTGYMDTNEGRKMHKSVMSMMMIIIRARIL